MRIALIPVFSLGLMVFFLLVTCELSPTDRDPISIAPPSSSVNDSTTSTKDPGLTSTTTSSSSEKIWSSTTDSTTSSSSDSTSSTSSSSVTDGDTTPPSAVSNASLSVYPNGHQLSLSWSNPTDPDFAGVLIRFSMTDFPESPDDGTFLVSLPRYVIPNNLYVHSGLINQLDYYYTVFVVDEAGNYSEGVNLSGIPLDTKPPNNIDSYNVNADPIPFGFQFSWDEFTGDDLDWDTLYIEINSSGSFPQSIGSGWQNLTLTNKHNEHSWQWTRGSNDYCGLLYHFSFFIIDEDGNEGPAYMAYEGRSGLDVPIFQEIKPGVERAYLRFRTTDSNYDTGVRIVMSDSGSDPTLDEDGTVITGDWVVDLPNLDNNNEDRSRWYEVTGLTAGTEYTFGIFSYLMDATYGDLYSEADIMKVTPLASVDKEWFEDFESFSVDTCPTSSTCTDKDGSSGIDTWAVESSGSYCYDGVQCLFSSGNNDNSWVQPPDWKSDRYAEAHYQWHPLPEGTNPDLTNYDHAILSFYGKINSNDGNWHLQVFMDGDIDTGDQVFSITDDGSHDRQDWSFYFIDIGAYCWQSPELNFVFKTDSGGTGSEGATIDNVRLIAWDE